MSTLTPILQTIATTCGLCHDQCVSACPVVESAQNLSAYPSRLATLAWELSRGNFQPGADAWQAFAHCIHCKSCMSNCVYIDEPVDVTPLVHWARQEILESDYISTQLQGILDQISLHGNPYGEVQSALADVKKRYQDDMKPGGTLVMVDAAQLVLDPTSVSASLQLLELLGYNDIRISNYTYIGWELWQYGCKPALLEIAGNIAQEIVHIQPETVISLSPSNAYLLGQFSQELGILVPAPVKSLHEAVLTRFDLLSGQLSRPAEPVFMVPSYCELNYLPKVYSRTVLEKMGVQRVSFPSRPLFRPVAYPDGLCLELDPDPGIVIARKIAQHIADAGICSVVCTTPFALRAMQAILPSRQVKDWSAFFVEHLSM